MAGRSFWPPTTNRGRRSTIKNLRGFGPGRRRHRVRRAVYPEQLAGDKKGWGHSSWLEGVRIARECNVKTLILFHHDPDSNDAHVDGLVMKARKEFPNTWGANEGMVISIPRGSIEHPVLIRDSERRADRRYNVELPLKVTWRDPGRQVA